MQNDTVRGRAVGLIVWFEGIRTVSTHDPPGLTPGARDPDNAGGGVLVDSH